MHSRFRTGWVDPTVEGPPRGLVGDGLHGRWVWCLVCRGWRRRGRWRDGGDGAGRVGRNVFGRCRDSRPQRRGGLWWGGAAGAAGPGPGFGGGGGGGSFVFETFPTSTVLLAVGGGGGAGDVSSEM